jgi:hypothetical protein
MGAPVWLLQQASGSGNGSEAGPRSLHTRHDGMRWNAPAAWLDRYLSLSAKIFVVGLQSHK